MTTTSDRCELHETPQPSICFTCNQINRNEWGSTAQELASEKENQ
ncbi:hypothetical protein [Pseudarthrobacter sp. Y6]